MAILVKHLKPGGKQPPWKAAWFISSSHFKMMTAASMPLYPDAMPCS